MRFALLALVALGVGTSLAAQDRGATPASIAAMPPEASRGRGAELPFVEYEAENAVTNGQVIGPDRRFTTVAAEASGRRAVRLERQGDFVEFTLGQAANAFTARIAIPDSPDGRGLDASLGVYVDGQRIGALATTSRYGWFYGDYPFTNRPADGRGHHVFDEPRLLLDRILPAGTRVRLQRGEGDAAPWYAVDLADFELVGPPAPRPAHALSLLAFGADPTGRRDSSEALRRAVEAARSRRRSLWIPPGHFRVNGHIAVDRVSIIGSGPWHSVLQGKGIGFYGRKAPGGSRKVELRDFAIFGEVTERKDHEQVNGIGGAIGGGSRIDNLWIQHVKVGLWFDGPMSGIRISRLRILDTIADGLNFHRGVSHARVENSFIRNTGDDGLAAWSGGAADHHVRLIRNTVIAPILANGIALYGGHDLEVTGNLVADTLTEGGGIHVGNRFSARPLSGRIEIYDNMIVRAGSFDPRWRFGVGALWFYALDAPIAADIRVKGGDIFDSSEEAVLLLGKPITGVSLDKVAITGTGSHAITLRSQASLGLRGVAARGLGAAAILACHDGAKPVDLGGNHGLADVRHSPCG